MTSRHCALVGVTVLMFFCLGSAHRLFLETRKGSMSPAARSIKQSQPTHDSKFESTHGLFTKPANEPLVVDYKAYESSKNLAREKLGPFPFAEEPTTKLWGLDRPAEKEKQDGEPWFAASLSKFGPASPKADWLGLKEGPIREFTLNPSENMYGIEEYHNAPPMEEWAKLKEGPIRDVTFSPSEGLYGIQKYDKSHKMPGPKQFQKSMSLVTSPIRALVHSPEVHGP